jgi:hypothetical protein
VVCTYILAQGEYRFVIPFGVAFVAGVVGVPLVVQAVR